jgi:hypothetical protein
VERVIKEERQKGNLENYTSLEFSETREEFSERFGNLRKEESAASERFGNFPNISETREFVSETKHTPESWDKESTESEPTRQMKELEKEMFDLKITNRGKDYFIEQLTKRNQELIEQLMQSSHTIGFLEAQVRQLAPPMHEGQGSGEPRVALEQSENNTPNNSSE